MGLRSPLTIFNRHYTRIREPVIFDPRDFEGLISLTFEFHFQKLPADSCDPEMMAKANHDAVHRLLEFLKICPASENSMCFVVTQGSIGLAQIESLYHWGFGGPCNFLLGVEE